MTDKTPLEQIMAIQEKQFLLDEKKKQWRILGKEVRSMSQKIPQMIREMQLK